MLSPRAESFKSDLISALNKELELARKLSQGERSNQATEGLLVKQQAGGYVYEFENLTGFPPDEGVQVSFTVGEKISKGKYLGEVNSKFLFELDSDLGERIDRVTVISDPLFLLEKQIDSLSKSTPFENQVALASVGLADYPKVQSTNADPKFMQGLNGIQKDSLSAVVSNSVTYIWGPPGTGKTTTMGSIVAALADAGQRVLLVSNTNLALDTAIERCLDRYSDYEELDDGLMLRLGTMVKPELVNKYGKQINLDEIHSKEVKALQEQIHSQSENLSDVRNRLSDLNDLRRRYEAANRDALGISKSQNEINLLIESISSANSEIDLINQQISKLEADYELAASKGSVSRIFSGLKNPNDLKIEINSNQRKKEKFETEIIVNERELGRLKSSQAEIQEISEIAKKWLQENADVEKEISKISNLEIESNTIQKQIDDLKTEISNKRSEILSRARVISCTAFKTILDAELSKQSFDCVVVDEASMLPLPLYYCAASLAISRIVVAGDFRQLPPIVRIGSVGESSQENAELDRLRDILSSNPFTKSGVITRINQSKELIALRDQYRMRESISNLISRNFYPEHTLRTINERLDKPTPWGNESFIFVDTESIDPESSTVNGRSRRNVAHAIVVQAIVEELYNDGWRLDSTAERSFAVISPYAKQSNFIEGLIGSSGEIKVKGGISTVHRFQGNERDLIIIDLTKVASSLEPGLGDFLGNPDPLATQNAMWNVAISRARQHVIVVGHKPTLLQNQTALISKLIESMKSDLKTVDAKTLIDFKTVNTKSKKSKNGSISWFSGTSFYEAFRSDLKSANQKLFLASPFTTTEGTERWISLFEELKIQNVEMVLLTKPLNEKSNRDESGEIHQKLEAIFKEVRTIPKMHEKIAVVDGNVVWLGSLNFLSHKNASEIMMRVESPEFAQSITDEYLLQRISGRKAPISNPDGTAIKAGDSCTRPGCLGKFVLKPAGVSKKSGRPYAAFLSCDQFPRCKNSVNF